MCCSFSSENAIVTASLIDLESLPQVPLPLDARNNPFCPINVDNSRELNLNQIPKAPTKLQISFHDFPRVISHGQVGDRLLFKNIVPLAEKWHLASVIWHDQHETEILRSFFDSAWFRENQPSLILDCACGTGFHAFLLSELGYQVTACDADEQNIKILRQQPAFDPDKHSVIDCKWQDLESRFDEQKFDCVLCLGSSITYYDSWAEGAQVNEFDPAELKAVLGQMESVLAPKGKLIIGFSRHYCTQLTRFECDFVEKEIRGVKFQMCWELNYDWQRHIKSWICQIVNENDEDFTFELNSYLFEIDQLQKACKEVFIDGNVEFKDIDSKYYDTFVVCTKSDVAKK